MNSTDLRPGNIVKSKSGFYLVVTEIMASGITYDQLAAFAVVGHAEWGEIEGVEITPEWLKRLGFLYLDSIINERYYVQWINSPSEIAWYPVGGYVSINTATGGEGEQPNYTESTLPHIKYLHQLQNLFYDLTGTELNFTL